MPSIHFRYSGIILNVLVRGRFRKEKLLEDPVHIYKKVLGFKIQICNIKSLVGPGRQRPPPFFFSTALKIM